MKDREKKRRSFLYQLLKVVIKLQKVKGEYSYEHWAGLTSKNKRDSTAEVEKKKDPMGKYCRRVYDIICLIMVTITTVIYLLLTFDSMIFTLRLCFFLSFRSTDLYPIITSNPP